MMAEYKGNSLVLFPSMVGFKLGLWQSGMSPWHLIVSSLWLPWCLAGGKESACDAGDTGSVPGPGRSPGDGNGNPLQYCWASLVAQLVKYLPAMRETWV